MSLLHNASEHIETLVIAVSQKFWIGGAVVTTAAGGIKQASEAVPAVSNYVDASLADAGVLVGMLVGVTGVFVHAIAQIRKDRREARQEARQREFHRERMSQLQDQTKDPLDTL